MGRVGAPHDKAYHSGGERGPALSHTTVSGHATVGGERAGFESYYSVRACHSGGREGWL